MGTIEFYVGRLVWKRHRFVNAPEAGQARPNPPADVEWIATSAHAKRRTDARRVALATELAATAEFDDLPVLHPGLAELYRRIGGVTLPPCALA